MLNYQNNYVKRMRLQKVFIFQLEHPIYLII